MKQLILVLMGIAPLICGAVEQTDRKEQGASILASSAVGEVIESEHGSYRIIPSGRVVLTTSLEVIGSNSPTSATTTDWSTQLGGFHLSIGDENLTVSARSGESTLNYRLAYNPKTGKPAIVTEKIIVHLNPGADIRAIAKVHALILSADYSHINAAVLKVNDPAQLMAVVISLRSDPGVKRAYAEVIEHPKTPR